MIIFFIIISSIHFIFVTKQNIQGVGDVKSSQKALYNLGNIKPSLLLFSFGGLYSQKVALQRKQLCKERCLHYFYCSSSFFQYNCITQGVEHTIKCYHYWELNTVLAIDSLQLILIFSKSGPMSAPVFIEKLGPDSLGKNEHWPNFVSLHTNNNSFFLFINEELQEG